MAEVAAAVADQHHDEKAKANEVGLNPARRYTWRTGASEIAKLEKANLVGKTILITGTNVGIGKRLYFHFTLIFSKKRRHEKSFFTVRSDDRRGFGC